MNITSRIQFDNLPEHQLQTQEQRRRVGGGGGGGGGGRLCIRMLMSNKPLKRQTKIAAF